MHDFVYDVSGSRVLFGAGMFSRLPEELERIGGRRPLFIATPGREPDAIRAAGTLEGRSAAVHAAAVMHVPVETIAEACAAAQAHRADSIVAYGGSSAIDTAKAVGLELSLPVIAVPMTYGGSEVTPSYGYTEGGIKKGKRDRRMLPVSVIYDPMLTVSLPRHVSGPSGINAIAHCVEGLYGRDANPVMSLLAKEGIRVLSRSLPAVVDDPADMPARKDALYGAWLAGMVLGSVGMALHHNIAHVVGGTFRLPHANVHTIVLPHAVAFNREAVPEAIAEVAAALGTSEAASGLFDLATRVAPPVALKDLGMAEADLDKAAQLVIEHPYYNPRPPELAAVRALLDNAYFGRRPVSGG